MCTLFLHFHILNLLSLRSVSNLLFPSMSAFPSSRFSCFINFVLSQVSPFLVATYHYLLYLLPSFTSSSFHRPPFYLLPLVFIFRKLSVLSDISPFSFVSTFSPHHLFLLPPRSILFFIFLFSAFYLFLIFSFFFNFYFFPSSF